MQSPTSVSELGAYSPSSSSAPFAYNGSSRFSPAVQKPYRAHIPHADTLNRTQIDVGARIRYFRAEQSHGVSTNSGLDLVRVAPILCEQVAPLVPSAAPGAPPSALTSAATTARGSPYPTPLSTHRSSPLKNAGAAATGARNRANSGAANSGTAPSHSFLKRKVSKIEYPPLVMRRKELGGRSSSNGNSNSKLTAGNTAMLAATAAGAGAGAGVEKLPVGWTTMHFAARNGKLEVCEYLIAHGNRSDVHEKEAGAGNTPLHIAAAAGYMHICEYLLRHGADVNARAKDGCSPLDRAMQSDRRQLSKYMRERGARNARYDPSALKVSGSRTSMPI